MKVATYNILKGGTQRVHWVKMIEDHAVDLLLVQESYVHDEHLPSLMYPDARSRSVWEMVEQNGWGSAVFSRTGSVKPVAVSGFSGWVVGARNQRGVLAGRVRRPALGLQRPRYRRGRKAYWKQVNKLLDEIKKVAGRREIVIGGDFNITVSNWCGSERPASKQDIGDSGEAGRRIRAAQLLARGEPGPAIAPDASVDRRSHLPVPLRRTFRAEGVEGSAPVMCRFWPETNGTASATTIRSWRAFRRWSGSPGVSRWGKGSAEDGAGQWPGWSGRRFRIIRRVCQGFFSSCLM